MIRHPRVGEYAFGFITGQTVLETDQGQTQLYSIYVPTNHGMLGLDVDFVVFARMQSSKHRPIYQLISILLPLPLLSEDTLGDTNLNFHSYHVVYVGDIFLLEDKDIIRNNLSVREGIEVVVSVGMAVPQRIMANKF